MYKLVISKFDGALINSEEAISADTVIEIDRIRNSGCLFCILTDRCVNDVLCYNNDFPFIDYIIACDGAYLYDVERNRIVYKRSITSAVLKKILNNFSNYNVYGFSEDERILISDIGNRKVYKLEIECCNKRDLVDVCDRLENLNLNINFSSKKHNKIYSVEIVMSGVDKCLVIEKICNLERINLADVIGIGVDDQDIAVLKLVGFGVAMKNGTSTLKKAADKITNSNDEEGLKKILNQLFG